MNIKMLDAMGVGRWRRFSRVQDLERAGETAEEKAKKATKKQGYSVASRVCWGHESRF